MEDRLLNEELSRSNAPRKWPLKLFECCEYRDIQVRIFVIFVYGRILTESTALKYFHAGKPKVVPAVLPQGCDVVRIAK